MKKCVTYFFGFTLLLLFALPVNAKEDPNHTWEDEAVYYILIDRFTNGDSTNDYDIDISDPVAYHGGDIQGVINKLDYIKQLGFTAINLSPLMSNQDGNYNGFLIDDFRSMEEQFGTIEDLNELVEKAHERDIKVVLDFVITHTSTNHPWLKTKQDWIAGSTSTIWGENLPSPELENPKVRQYFVETAAFWFNETGIDGYRLYTNETTPNQFIEEFIEQMHQLDSDFLIMVDSSSELEQIQDQTEVNAVMNNRLYKDATAVFSSAGNSLDPLVSSWTEQRSDVQGTYLDRLETARFTREAVKQGQNPITRWKLALTYLYTTPGVPVVYQGSEIPMDNGMDTPDHRMAELNSGEDELKTYLEQLAAIRKQFPALTHGDIELVKNNDAMSMYKRTYQDETIYIAINNDVETKTITLNDMPQGMQLTGLLQDNIVRELDNGEFRIALDRETADIFIIEEDTGLNWIFISFVLLVLGGFVFSVIYLSIKGNQKD